MEFDFTSRWDRRLHPSKKWTRYPRDVLPLWVADTDFAVAPVIVEALQERLAEHPLFGYTAPPKALVEALCQWSLDHYQWQIEPAWQQWLAGAVPALHVASLALTEPGDELLTVTPIYPLFLDVGKKTGRTMLTVPMLPPSDEIPHWHLDRDAFENVVTPRTRMLLWCHPHNPTGRVFDHEELEWLADFVERHDLLVCSDELHCDLIVAPECRHIPLASMNARIARRTITLWAATKTFNIAGLTTCCAVISDAKLRQRFRDGCEGLMPSHNVLGLIATEAAYREGNAWRLELLKVLRSNLTLLERHVERWTGITCIPSQATFLAWLDCRHAGLGENPQQVLLEKARVGLSDGADFGWPGFVRINLGAPTAIIGEALERMDALLGPSTNR
ncbi:MalY/PatB family protein [Carnimonas nigrificans]|uniref:MalY/PatB family protein n=1 Tax=Carnimonas nigrificans TaxID=64323 RepID=UPI0004711F07|nr:PatB family C-S lyase [Carnimonas nigrificans]